MAVNNKYIKKSLLSLPFFIFTLWTGCMYTTFLGVCLFISKFNNYE